MKNQSGFTGARDSEWQWNQIGHMPAPYNSHGYICQTYSKGTFIFIKESSPKLFGKNMSPSLMAETALIKY